MFSLLETFFQEKCRSRVHPCEKRTPPQGLSGMDSARYLFSVFRKTFCQLSLYSFHTGGCNFTEEIFWNIQYVELTFSSKDNFNCVTDNVYIWMSMPMSVPMPRCRCQDSQMASPRKHLLLFKTSWRRLQDMSWKRLQHVFSITIFCLPRRLEDVLEDEKLLLWKTSSKHVLKTSWRRLGDKQNV